MLTDNLVAYWKLDGNSNDSGANAYNGTDTSMSYVAGKIWDCWEFNWSTSKIDLANGAWFTGNAARTIAAWVKIDSIWGNNYYSIFANGANSWWQDFQFILHTPDSTTANLYVRRYFDDQNSVNIYSSINTTDFFHVAVTYNWVTTWTATNGAWIRFYLNGAEIDRWTSKTNVTFNTSQSNVWISRPLWTSYWDWKIDEVWVRGRELTSSEITTLYNSGNWLSYPFETSDIKTINGLNRANVKTVNGLAIANVKTFNWLE